MFQGLKLYQLQTWLRVKLFYIVAGMVTHCKNSFRQTFDES